MNKTVIILLIISCFSCKEGKNKEAQIVEVPVEDIIKDDILKIFLDIKILEDDKFDVFYVSDSPEGNFDPNNRAATYVKGNVDFQLISVNLPQGILPYKLRIDLGDNVNKHETNIEIRSIKFQLNGNSFKIDNNIMNSFFQPNVFLQKLENGYSRKVVDGRYDPFLMATPLLIKKMEIEL